MVYLVKNGSPLTCRVFQSGLCRFYDPGTVQHIPIFPTNWKLDLKSALDLASISLAAFSVAVWSSLRRYRRSTSLFIILRAADA